jgi:hypothetical protein
MIPIDTELLPRNADAPIVSVCGIEGDRYVLAPVEFGSPFSMGYDAITAAYVCDDFAVQIERETEVELWKRFSNEKFDQAMQRPHREVVREPSPEDVFRAAAEDDAV